MNKPLFAEDLLPPRLLATRPALTAVLVAIACAGLGTVVRDYLVVPQAIGDLCGSAQAPWWCPARTGLIVAIQRDGLGYAATLLAALSIILRSRVAIALAFAAMAIGGIGLVLYNATGAALGVVPALLRLAWIERRGP
jgi:hypothetical protein